MRTKIFSPVLMFVVCTYNAAAIADIVTFEDLSGYPNQNFNVFWTSPEHFSSGGFSFSIVGLAPYIARGQSCSPSCPVNGTNYLLSANGPTSVTMSTPGGGLFSLSGFDGAGSFNMNQYWSRPDWIPNQFDVIGNVYGGGTVSQSFLIDKTSNSTGTLNFRTYSLGSSFDNLTSVTFSTSGSSDPAFNGFSIDNIHVTPTAPIPEPETYAMMLAGLGLLGVMAQRRKLSAD